MLITAITRLLFLAALKDAASQAAYAFDAGIIATPAIDAILASCHYILATAGCFRAQISRDKRQAAAEGRTCHYAILPDNTLLTD